MEGETEKSGGRDERVRGRDKGSEGVWSERERQGE